MATNLRFWPKSDARTSPALVAGFFCPNRSEIGPYRHCIDRAQGSVGETLLVNADEIPIKAHPAKAGAAKPRVLASSDTPWKTPPKDPKNAGLPNYHM